MAVNKYIGKELINKLEGQAFLSSKDISTHLLSDSKTGTGDWVDLAGMFAPKSEVTRLTNRIVTESISLENIQTELGLLHENYPQFSFNFAMDLLEKRTEKSIQNLEIQDIITVIEKWKHAELTFDDLVLRDAKKEFNTISRIGFGLDGDDEQKNLDFDAVRGTFENNPFVKEILKRGIFIYHVDNLADAIEIVKKCKIDLIVSDGMFPKKKGMKEEKNFIPLLEVLEKNKVNTPVIAWANSTHVHEYCKKNKLPSYSKIKVTHEMFERRGRKYFPVPLKNHLEIADLVEEKLIEASNLKKVLSKYIFSEYYKEPITVLGAFMAAEMRTKMFKQTSGRNYGPIIFEMNKGLGRCLVDDKDDKKIALSIFNKIEKQNFFPEIRREVNLRAKKLSVFSKILRETNYSTLSNEELAKMYLKFVELFMQMRIYSSLPTAMEHETNTWTEYLKTILKPKIKDVSEYNKVFSTLTTPIKASYLNRYEVDVAQLGELKYSGKLTEKKVGEIVKKWAFVNFTFEGVPITAKDIYNKMKVLGKNTRDFSDFLKEQEERPRKIELLKKEFFKKYNFSKKEKEMFEIGADIVFI